MPISWVGGGGRVCPGWGWPEEDGSGGALCGVEGGGLVDAWDAEGAPAADFAASDVEAVGSDGLLPLADDTPDGGVSFAVGFSAHTQVVSFVLELGEEFPGAVGESLASAEVDGALSAGDTVGDAVVWAVAGFSASSVACDDGAALGEDLGVVVDEVEWCGHGWLSGVRSRESGRGWWAA